MHVNICCNNYGIKLSEQYKAWVVYRLEINTDQHFHWLTFYWGADGRWVAVSRGVALEEPLLFPDRAAAVSYARENNLH